MTPPSSVTGTSTDSAGIPPWTGVPVPPVSSPDVSSPPVGSLLLSSAAWFGSSSREPSQIPTPTAAATIAATSTATRTTRPLRRGRGPGATGTGAGAKSSVFGKVRGVCAVSGAGGAGRSEGGYGGGGSVDGCEGGSVDGYEGGGGGGLVGTPVIGMLCGPVGRNVGRLDQAQRIADYRDRPATPGQVVGAAIAREGVSGLLHRGLRTAAVRQDRAQPDDGTEPHRVHEQVELAGGGLVLGQEVVEGGTERLGGVDHVRSLTRHQFAQVLVQVHPAPSGRTRS